MDPINGLQFLTFKGIVKFSDKFVKYDRQTIERPLMFN